MAKKAKEKKAEKKNPAEFEQLNTRIHSLIVDRGATVQWDAAIPDPDLPSVMRQIDVLITTADGRRISVECRDRGGAQNVMWIEELAGRKESLGLDGMIAVSIRGFSALAAKKAARFGIVLYDFKLLSNSEIASWVDVTQIRAKFLQFSKLDISATMPAGSHPKLQTNTNFRNGPKDGFGAVMNFIRDNLGSGTIPASGNVSIPSSGYMIDGIMPTDLSAEYIVDKVEQVATCTSVMMCDHPDKPAILRDVSVERFDHSVSELITHKGDLHLTIDVDRVICPDNSILDEIEIESSTATNLEKYELVGNRNLDSKSTIVSLEIR